MALTQVVLRLAGNSVDSYGDDDRGFIIASPLDDNGRLDANVWSRDREACTVASFTPFGERRVGFLSCRGADWLIASDIDGDESANPVFRFKNLQLSIGQYVSLQTRDGKSLTYRVSEHHPLGCNPLQLGRAALREANW